MTPQAPWGLKHATELQQNGFTVLPGYVSPGWNRRLLARLSHFSEAFPGRKRLLPDEEFVAFITTDELLAIPQTLFGSDFLFHHANGRMACDARGKVWHHDRDGAPAAGSQNARMYHVMVYPAGLPEDVAPLVVKPGSHRQIVDRHTPNKLGLEIGPDDLAIRGASGLTVVLDSALWHMRPAGTLGVPRYDLNVSFCDSVGVWPERYECGAVLEEVAATVDPRYAPLFG